MAFRFCCGATTQSADDLISRLREYFQTFGVPSELASDGGPTFVAEKTRAFLRDWGVRHRVSSVAFAHSNTRAELGVKSAKRMIRDNTGPRSKLNADRFSRALFEHRNTPDPDTGLSPAHVIYGRQIRDFIPSLSGNYKPRKEWLLAAHDREMALAKRHSREIERLHEHVKRLPPLQVGDCVLLQNQTGLRPLKWDKTGRIVEVRKFDQYLIKTDGSGRCSIRNRKFIRKIQPIMTMPVPRSHPPSPPSMAVPVRYQQHIHSLPTAVFHLFQSRRMTHPRVTMLTPSHPSQTYNHRIRRVHTPRSGGFRRPRLPWNHLQPIRGHPMLCPR